jgi:predicted CXXCH cytochrome family protein
MAYSINQENHDVFCASCHTQPETSFYQASLNASPQTLAAFHTTKNVRCIDCHSGGGPLGRLAGLDRGAHDLIAYMSGHYNNPAVTTQPLGDGSCLKCHENIYNNQTFNNHFHLFLSRWQAVDPQAAHCVDCHTSHISGPTDQAYLQDATVEPVCQACHSAIRE